MQIDYEISFMGYDTFTVWLLINCIKFKIFNFHKINLIKYYKMSGPDRMTYILKVPYILYSTDPSAPILQSIDLGNQI